MTLVRLVVSFLAALAIVGSAEVVVAQPAWVEVLPGLEMARSSPTGETLHWIAVRADPNRFEVVALSAGASKGRLTVDEWGREQNLTVVVNAGMYQKDGRTPVGYLRAGGRDFGRWRKGYQAALVAGPEDPKRPAVLILDAACDGPLSVAARGYRHVVQGIRLLTCLGENTFRPGGRRAARLAAAVDGAGRLLFIFHRTPIAMHDFIEWIREAGLDVRRMMYLEGGSEASLVLRGSSGEARFGGLGLAVFGWTHVPEGLLLPIPNVIGLRPRP